jgi:hypothetical protein
MKPSTVLNMRGYLPNHLLPFFGKRQVRDVAARDIDTFLSKLAVSRSTPPSRRPGVCALGSPRILIDSVRCPSPEFHPRREWRGSVRHKVRARTRPRIVFGRGRQLASPNNGHSYGRNKT